MLKVRSAKEISGGFAEDCEKDGKPELWAQAIETALEDNPDWGRGQVEAFLAANAARDLTRLEAELAAMQVRSGGIMTAAVFVSAVVTQEPANTPLKLLLAATLACTALAFVVALIPMAPPFRRAWTSAYDPRHIHTLLSTSYFKRWVWDCWLSERRIPIITKYKKAHEICVYLLIAAAVLAGVVLSANQLY